MKTPWYVKSNKKGTEIKFHWLWVFLQVIKISFKRLFTKNKDIHK